MKKTLVLLTALLAVNFAYAQQLPDGGFENWKKDGPNYVGDYYDELGDPFWQTLNMLSTLEPEMGTGPVVVFKDKGKRGSCPRMVSGSLQLGEKTIFLPGVVGSFTVDIKNQTAHFGRPYTCPQEAIKDEGQEEVKEDGLVLKGFMKYKPVNNDSASIFVEVYRTVDGKREMVGHVEQKYYNAIDTWTEFALPIRWRNIEDASQIDSICVLFVSSAGYNWNDLFECKGQIGSTLLVDGWRFVIDGNDPGAPDADLPENPDNPITANEALNTLNVRAYPNPATDVLNVTVEENAQLVIFDQAGRVLLQQAVKAGENTLNIAELKAGFYTFRVTGAQKSGSGKFIKR